MPLVRYKDGSMVPFKYDPRSVARLVRAGLEIHPDPGVSGFIEAQQISEVVKELAKAYGLTKEQDEKL